MPTWIATRILIDEKGKPLEVRIGKPRHPRNSEWLCDVMIGDEVHTGHGEDSVQALILGIEMVRVKLAGRKVSWFAGQPGAHHFPMYIHTLFDLKLTHRLEHMATKETERFAKKVIIDGRRKLRVPNRALKKRR